MASHMPPDSDDFFSADLHRDTATQNQQTCTLSCVSAILNPFGPSAAERGARRETREDYLAKKKIAHATYIAQRADKIGKKYMTGRSASQSGLENAALPAVSSTSAAATSSENEWLLRGV